MYYNESSCDLVKVQIKRPATIELSNETVTIVFELNLQWLATICSCHEHP